MPTTRPDAARRWRATPKRHVVALAAIVLLAACSSATPTPTPEPTPLPTAVPTPTPEPTPQPTPIFSNVPDPELVALIPTTVAGKAVQIPAITEFGITPGDIGEVYGEIGARFRSLQVAYISRPRLSLYAMRMNAPLVLTADLEPYLAAAGEYVGIAGLHREPWTLQTVAGHVVWVRPELVVEVAFNDLQASPQYPGGLALRFARIKGYRPDKSPADADTIATLREIWRRQSGGGTDTA